MGTHSTTTVHRNTELILTIPTAHLNFTVHLYPFSLILRFFSSSITISLTDSHFLCLSYPSVSYVSYPLHFSFLLSVHFSFIVPNRMMSECSYMKNNPHPFLHFFSSLSISYLTLCHLPTLSLSLSLNIHISLSNSAHPSLHFTVS